MNQNVYASAVATTCAEIATLPICTIKTNYQNSASTSIQHTIRFIYKQHGIKGFYNASGWAISSQVLATTSKYTLYQSFKDMTNNSIIAGASSGFVASSMTHPFDVLKIHYQMHTPFVPELKKYGPMLFYRGYSKTMSKSVFSSLFFFPLYDFFRSRINVSNDSINASIAAFCSAIVSTTMMQPLDYMKTRQVYGLKFWSTNVGDYFKGYTINLMRIVPHFVIVMTVIDFLKK